MRQTTSVFEVKVTKADSRKALEINMIVNQSCRETSRKGIGNQRMGLMEKIFGDLNTKEVKKVEKIADQVMALDGSDGGTVR